MKAKIFLPAAISIFFVAHAHLVFGEDLPKKFEFARYEPMMNRSPFAVATAVAAPAATPNFAKDLYVANAARTPEGDFVTIASLTDKNFKLYLSTKAPEKGYSIPGIDWSDKIGGTKVTISKDGQTATLTFNQALLTQPLATAPAQPNQPVTANPAPITNIPRPAGQPGMPTPPPRARGPIQRNPVAVPATPPPTPAIVPPEVES